MPILRLRRHLATSSDEDVLINPSDFVGLKLNDIVELLPTKGGNLSNRILLQVKKWPETNIHPNSISIKDSVLVTHLKPYSDVLVNIVNQRDVLIDSIEICFSNAYLARSYMWGLKNHLNNKCVNQHQKLDYLHIRSQICDIWSQGEKVSAGYVDDDTKIVFRSASSLVYLFIQMSTEMWDYDINGDLYCEKAVSGFLTDLFEKWRKDDCSHDITIILFSRTFYDAESIEEFPEEMRKCLQLDYKNRFYEDCYRVAFQNDRFDLHDWGAKLITLKSIFNQYQEEVIDRHQNKYARKIPKAYNSTASQGNFLEVLNMSLNVFEKHYFDRSFDRTGQLSVVVSPGVGVFEVDFELTNLTKQRIIDNGIGSDLVCLGEQPLHTVPLLKFNSKSSQLDNNLTTCDVYNMPHWINLSFYSSESQYYYTSFIPRIKLPTLHKDKLASKFCDNRQPYQSKLNEYKCDDLTKDEESCSKNRPKGPRFTDHSTMPDLVDYDSYDSQVFKPNPLMPYHYNQRFTHGNRSILSSCKMDGDQDNDFLNKDNRSRSTNIHRRSSDVKNYQEYKKSINRQMSDNLPIGQSRVSPQAQPPFTRLSLVDSYMNDVKVRPESADDLSVRGYNVQSSRMSRTTRPKALINPFDPSHMTIKLTPNRRRWTHVFPQGPTGTFIQQHHHQPIRNKSNGSYLTNEVPQAIPENAAIELKSGNENEKPPSSTRDNSKRILPNLNSENHEVNSSDASHSKSALVSNETIRFAWCASGEQEWTPLTTTGVDWKSLTMPACLPLTTDFFPSRTSLQNDYVVGEYNIDSSCIHPRLSLIEVYRELVCQRLQKGFQIILLPRLAKGDSEEKFIIQKNSRHKSSRVSTPTTWNGNQGLERERTEYTMSIGRIFHKLSLNGNTITVTQYRPRHPYPIIKIDYCYRFRAPFHEAYGQSWVHFKSEQLENYSWNYLDNYICARGDSYELRSSLKFWRFRVLVLPSRLNLTRINHDDENNAHRHDIYPPSFTDKERDALIDSFVKLLDIINKTRRASANRVSSLVNVASAGTTSSAPNQSPQSAKSQQQQFQSIPKLNVQIESNPANKAERESPNTADDETNEDKLKLYFESITMDIDSALRDAKRAEWVHMQYHNCYHVNHAFELVIKWMVASGAGIAEMVQSWSRKAGNHSSVHLVPIPWEPFAMPYSGKADPLRCPIGIPLNLDAFSDGCTLSDIQVISFQEKILRRYGFVVFHDLISTEDIERQFVHMSGFAFVALPNISENLCESSQGESQVGSPQVLSTPQQPVLLSSKLDSGNARLKSPTRKITKTKTTSSVVTSLKLIHQETISSPHEEYITRHIGGVRQSKANRLRGEGELVEFIWSWNYMLTKRWRSTSTQDEVYAVNLMQDFKSFCQGIDGRLTKFWNEVKDAIHQ